MEDYHVAEYKCEHGHELGLFAIFDGHLGDGVPSYLKDNLFKNIISEVKSNLVHPPFNPVGVFVISLESCVAGKLTIFVMRGT